MLELYGVCPTIDVLRKSSYVHDFDRLHSITLRSRFVFTQVDDIVFVYKQRIKQVSLNVYSFTD